MLTQRQNRRLRHGRAAVDLCEYHISHAARSVAVWSVAGLHVQSLWHIVGQSVIIGSIVCFYARSKLEMTGV